MKNSKLTYLCTKILVLDDYKFYYEIKKGNYLWKMQKFVTITI